MEYQAKLTYGSAEFVISTDSAPEARDELKKTAKFIQDEMGDYKHIFFPEGGPKVGKVQEVSPEHTSDLEDGSVIEETEVSGCHEKIAQEVRVPVNYLRQMLVVEDNDMPVLDLNDKSVLGTGKTDRQRVASLILLYTWQVCFDESRVKSSLLKDALRLSRINNESMANMYQGRGDTYFNRGGRGPTATVGLTGIGKRQARKVIQELVDELENSSAEGLDSDGSSSLLDY